MNRTVSIALVCGLLSVAGAAKAESDQQFASKVSKQNTGEKKISQLAEKKASNSHVKSFAQQTTQQSQELEQYLGGLARLHGFKLPKSPSKQDQNRYQRLSKLSGKKFDHAYIDEQVQAYKTALSEFQNESKSGQSALAKDLASKAVPKLKSDLNQAQSLQANLKSGGSGSGGGSKSSRQGQ